jgi:Xaa-Pro aminopeptidase
MMDGLRKICSGRQNLAMQFSPNNMLFTVSMVDAGTVDLIRSFGVNVISSAELVAEFESAWSEEQIETHFAARDSIDSIVDETFREIGHRVRNGGTTEFAIQQCIVEAFRRERLISDGPPIVAINENCSNPHYVPSREHFAQIDVGDLVLLDVWGKKDVKNSVYYDISWVAFAGDVVPDRVVKVFDIVRCARDAAIDKVRSSVQEEKRIAGWEVDRAAREIIERAGYGGYLRNRVGHSIGIDVHGNGANIDDYESHEERSLLPNTCFSIEPGIYLPDFGLRSEVNMLVREMSAEVTGKVQEKIVLL